MSDVYLAPVLERLDVDGFWDYKEWQDARPDLSRYIINRFSGSLHGETGFTDDNPPEKPTSKKIPCGSVVFKVASKKEIKRPRYADIYHEFSDFIAGLKASYEAGRLKKGYRTVEIEGKKVVFISLEVLLEKLLIDVKTMLSEKEGVKHKITLVEPAELITKVPEVITIVTGTDYTALMEYNARMYQEAINLKEEGDLRTGFGQKKEAKKRFKKILLEDSFGRLGGKPDQYVKVPYPFGGITFRHHIKPESTVSYESIIDAFLKPIPGTLRKGGRVGDLIMAAALDPGLVDRLRKKGLLDEEMAAALKVDGLVDKLKEKGIWDDKFEQAYVPRVIDKKAYVLLSGPTKRLEYFKDNKYTSTTYNQFVSVNRTRK